MGLLGASFCCLKYLSFFPSKTKYRRFQLLRTPPCLSNQPSIVGRPCIAKACVCCRALRVTNKKQSSPQLPPGKGPKK